MAKATNDNRKKKLRSEGITTAQAIGIILFVFSIVILLCLISGGALFGGIGREINAFIVAVFGFFSYAFFAILTYVGVALFAGLKFAIRPRRAVALVLMLVFALLALQLVTTSSLLTGDRVGFNQYISACYQRGLQGMSAASAGGAFFALLLYPLYALIGRVGCYIIFALGFVLLTFSVVNFKAVFSYQKDGRDFVSKDKIAGYAEYDLSGLPKDDNGVESSDGQGGRYRSKEASEQSDKPIENLETIQNHLFVTNVADQSLPQKKKKQVSGVGYDILLGSEGEDGNRVDYPDNEPREGVDTTRQTSASANANVFGGNRTTDFAVNPRENIRSSSNRVEDANAASRDLGSGSDGFSRDRQSLSRRPESENARRTLFDVEPPDRKEVKSSASYTENYDNMTMEEKKRVIMKPMPFTIDPKSIQDDKTVTRATRYQPEPIVDKAHIHRDSLRPDNGTVGETSSRNSRHRRSILDNQTNLLDNMTVTPVLPEPVVDKNSAMRDKYKDYLPQKPPENLPPIIMGSSVKEEKKPVAQVPMEKMDMFGGKVGDILPNQKPIINAVTPQRHTISSQIPGFLPPQLRDNEDADSLNETVGNSEFLSKTNGFSSSGQSISKPKVEENKPLLEERAYTEILPAGFYASNAEMSLVDEYGRKMNVPSHMKAPEPAIGRIAPDPILEKAEVELLRPPAKIPMSPYNPPSVDLLKDMYFDPNEVQEDFEAKAAKLEKTLEDFKVSAKVINITPGPSVTRYELQMPAGVPVSRVVNLSDDIAMCLASKGEVRIEAPIPGMNLLGIEIPNAKKIKVGLKDVLDSDEFFSHKSPLAFALGKDIAGNNVIADICKMPHILIAGSTGSGKSVCLNALIISLLYKSSPEDVRIILIDPKRVEFNMYTGLPHLMLKNVITDPDKAIAAFGWAINEMNQRFELFKLKGAKDINSYNDRIDLETEQKMFRIVIVVDELAELMMGKQKQDIEDRIKRLAQLSRAAGIHLVLATQRPSVDIITGVIKANLPSRVSFRVISQIDSRTVMDSVGAEKLLGEGDMLYITGNMSKPLRLQGPFVSVDEVEAIVGYVRDHNEAYYDTSIEQSIMVDKKKEEENEEANTNGTMNEDSENGKLIPKVLRMGIESGSLSISMVQRKFGVGYARAGKLIDELEKLGYISQFEGSKPRQVYLTMEEFESKFKDSES